MEQDWLSLTGTHDVYIRFNGGGGIANLDNVRFGKPQPQSGPNLVIDGGFETGIAGWSSWNGATLDASNAQAHSGAQSLHATNRPNANQFAVYSLTSKVQTNTTYSVSAWALINWSRQRHCAPGGEGGMRGCGRYVPLAAEQHGGGSGHMDAALRQSGHSGGLHAYRCRDLLRGDRSQRSDVYVDDVKVVPPSNNLVTDGGFEAGIAGWSSWNGAIAGSKQCTGAHRRAESACDEPSQRQSVRRLQPHGQGPDQHHLRVSAWA